MVQLASTGLKTNGVCLMPVEAKCTMCRNLNGVLISHVGVVCTGIISFHWQQTKSVISFQTLKFQHF